MSKVLLIIIGVTFLSGCNNTAWEEYKYSRFLEVDNKVKELDIKISTLMDDHVRLNARVNLLEMEQIKLQKDYVSFLEHHNELIRHLNQKFSELENKEIKTTEFTDHIQDLIYRKYWGNNNYGMDNIIKRALAINRIIYFGNDGKPYYLIIKE